LKIYSVSGSVRLKALLCHGGVMVPREELKSRICQAIESSADEIIQVAKTILQTPEPGFREIKTSQLVSEKFTELGIVHRNSLARTGIKGIVNCGNEGPTVAVLGELDSLIVPTHTEADPETGAAHACGHNAQIGMLTGVATGLMKSGILPSLSGRVAFIAVPAEEYIEIEFREGLREEGKISYLGGKPELIKLGEFDDIDMAMITHTASTAMMRKRLIGVGGTSNGCLAKQIQFIGRGAHAGAAPHAGVNALNAAMIALSAIHTQRETFKDTDTVRVHPIITKGGEVVNIVPDDVRMETFVRGKTLEVIKDANEKVDRALRAGALAVGGSVRINTLPGYLPMVSDRNLQAVYRANASWLVGKNKVTPSGRHGTGSTDMGDISHIMPAIHPYTAGASGTSHGNDYLIEDYNLAKEVIKKHNAIMTKQEYLDLMENLRIEEEYQG
jgi:amidohydrolase